ncbi:VirD4-like conjugal transfer protein, CD1115 family [Streptococcus iniae]|uniref:VirD4-like conjugal transfer protein, CD1115 family n=1 Tax=Streptococcus agalactiae TaxID=1311 RepID=UPI0008DA3A69|nr:type IV secretory system conjugative DNA transfer family protein [Streptococcus agalactiae]ELY5747377.1 type IV secretory system conjugative DNA transfer family protein [Streptococcus iniae]KAF0052062.1 TraM recognition domain-containing protein [Streptococcus agalactiae]OHX26187.1 conjugal transfer protein TraD [Streptococcus iniae]
MIPSRKRPKKPYFYLGLFLFILINYLVRRVELEPLPPDSLDLMGLERLTSVFNRPFDNIIALVTISPKSVLIGLSGFLIAFFSYYSYTSDKGVYRFGEEHGSARFATAQELEKFRDSDPDNDMIFTQHAYMGLFNKRLAYAVQLNKNTLTIGLPGDGKTRALIKPNIMQANASFVITDPKGLLVHEVGHLLKEKGYAIKVLDLVTLSNSNHFNVFNYMTSENDIDRVAESIVNGTKKTDNQGEDFWAQAEMLLIRALVGYLYFNDKVLGEATPNLGKIADMLRNLKRDDPDVKSPVELLFRDLEKKLPNNYACKQFDLFMSNFKGQTLMSVLAIASSRFSVFDHEAVRDLISEDNMAIETWQTKKTAVFIAIPETDRTYNFLANLLFVTMLRVLPTTADEILQGRHQSFQSTDLLAIRLLMDEFAQIGKIPYFVESQSSVRSRGISMDIVLQALNQLKATYRDDWKTILNNCSVLLYLGTNDEETMKYFSMRAGKQTIQQKSSSQSYGQQGSSSDSTQNTQRDLMTPDEVARIGIDEALVFFSKQHVFKDKKFRLESHKHYKLLAESPEDKERWYTYDMSTADIEEFEANVLNPDIVTVDCHGKEEENESFL